MPKFSWKKFFAELGRTLLPIVVSQVLPSLVEKLDSTANGPSTGEDDPNQVIYGRRSTDTFDEAERISKEISTPVQKYVKIPN